MKSGAGQYFTPRPLIQAMVQVLDPKLGETVHDPACGTGGFLLAACEYLKRPGAAAMDRTQQRRLREATFSGVDIVDEVRLAAMNFYLHGIGAAGSGECPIRAADALAVEPGESFDLILTNLPFGKKSSCRVVLTHNHASRRAAESLGAQRECEARNRLQFQGAPHNAFV